jgi:hypothetical protein
MGRLCKLLDGRIVHFWSINEVDETVDVLIRVLNNVRGDEFDATNGLGYEITVHSCEASNYELLEDGSNFKPSK